MSSLDTRPRHGQPLFRRVALTAVATVVAFTSVGMAAAQASAESSCRDSSAVRHAKARDRGDLTVDITRFNQRVQSAQDDFALDTIRLKNLLAHSSTTLDDKNEAEAAVTADRGAITAFKHAMTHAQQDQRYLARCGATALKTGERRVLRHAYGLSIALDEAELTQENAIYHADRNRYYIYRGSGELEKAAVYESLMDSATEVIQSLERELSYLRKARRHA